MLSTAPLEAATHAPRISCTQQAAQDYTCHAATVAGSSLPSLLPLVVGWARERCLKEAQHTHPRVRRGERSAPRRPAEVALDARHRMREGGLGGRDIGPPN